MTTGEDAARAFAQMIGASLSLREMYIESEELDLSAITELEQALEEATVTLGKFLSGIGVI